MPARILAPGGGQQPQSHGAGTLDVFDLLDQYENQRGSNYTLTKNTFNQFIGDMRAAGKLKINGGQPVPNVKGLYQVTVDTKGTSYYYAVGLATLYYNSTGFVGYSDWWNFDAKPWGTRSFLGEVATRYGSTLWGQPFMVLYGITPPQNTIPKN